MPLHELNNKEGYVNSTYRLHELHVRVVSGYVSTTNRQYIIDEMFHKSSFRVSIVLVFVNGPGMSFLEGILCPQALQTCCDTQPLFE